MGSPLIVVDIGNSALHFGVFEDAASQEYATPKHVLRLAIDSMDWTLVTDWLAAHHMQECAWRIGSVNPGAQDWLLDKIRIRSQRAEIVTFETLPISVALQKPQAVGIDRLAAAAAANHLRNELWPAIIVDAGTAITVDCVSPAGAFLGGVIAPGIDLSMDCLSRRTALLPETQMKTTPSLVGKSTSAAIQSGVYWLTVGGIDHLVEKLKTEMASPCSVFATGGSMPQLLPNLGAANLGAANACGQTVQHFPHLVMSGLALACFR